MKPAVFVSHAWGKENVPHEFAKALVTQLRTLRMHCKIDERILVFGDVWKQVIERVIDAENTVSVALLSPEYMNSPNCAYELGRLTEAAYALGKPVIPVVLRKFSGVRTVFGEDVIYQDLSKLYREFQSKRGLRLSKRWMVDLRRRALELKRAVELQYSRYMSSLHICRIDPRNPVFERSLSLYMAYPNEYRDPPDRLHNWLYESTLEEAENYPKELYLVASYQSRIVGVLYATVYRSSLGIPATCHISMMAVRQKKDRVEVQLDTGEVTDVSVAEALLERLMVEARRVEPGCDTYTTELPIPTDDADKDVAACWYAWSTLPPESTTVQLMRCRDFVFHQPDTEWQGSSQRRPEAEEALLILLRRPAMRRHLSLDRFKELLFVLYWTLYAESYHDPHNIKSWIEHVSGLYDRAASSVGKEGVVLEQVDPTKWQDLR